MSLSKHSLRWLACLEWLVVLPPAVFLTAALLRLLQPEDHEPARASWIIVEWTARNVSHSEAELLLFGFPALVALAGSAALVRIWNEDQTLRLDATAAAAALWRHRVVVLLGAGAAVGLAIVFLVIGHTVADLPR